MSGLPEGWEADYDGSRWFYRYKATGIVQFRFPQDGDEFPEWYEDGNDDVPLEPEAWLASEQQVRRRSTLGSDPEIPAGELPPKVAASRRKRSESIPEDEEMSATGYFDPSSFMYFGPGGDISPVAEADDDAGDQASTARKSATPVPSAGPTPSTVHSQVSPIPEPPAQIDPHALAAELPEDNAQLWRPTGFVAELPTLDTLKCAEELAPVEMDGTSHIPIPVQPTYDRSGPVELPIDREPREIKAEDRTSTSATSVVVKPPAQFVTEYPLVSASFGYPTALNGMPPSRHQSPLQPLDSTVSKSPERQSPQQSPAPVLNDAARQRSASPQKRNDARAEAVKFQPWSPPKNVAEGNPSQGKRSSMILSGPSVLQTQESELGNMRRASESASVSVHQSLWQKSLFSPPQDPRVAGSSVSVSPLSSTSASAATPELPKSPIPQILQPANLNKRASVPEVPDLSRADTRQSQGHDLPGTSARHASISSGATVHSRGDAHPTLLTPAGRELYHVQSSQDLKGQASPQPPVRSASAFPAYVTAQRGLRSPLVDQKAQVDSQALSTAGKEVSAHPPGPRRLYSEPYLNTAGKSARSGSAVICGTGGPQGIHAPTELSSENATQCVQSTQSMTETRLQDHRRAEAPLKEVEPLSLKRSKSPSPEARTDKTPEKRDGAVRAGPNDLLSEVISVIDDSTRTNKRSNALPQPSEPPAILAEGPARALALPAEHQQPYASGYNSDSAQLSQNRGAALSVPSVTDQSFVSPLSSPVPSRQQSLTGDTRQPSNTTTDSETHDLSEMPFEIEMASTHHIHNQAPQDRGRHTDATGQQEVPLALLNANIMRSTTSLPPTTVVSHGSAPAITGALEASQSSSPNLEATQHSAILPSDLQQLSEPSSGAQPPHSHQQRPPPLEARKQLGTPQIIAEAIHDVRHGHVESSAPSSQQSQSVDGLKQTSQVLSEKPTTRTMPSPQDLPDTAPAVAGTADTAAPTRTTTASSPHPLKEQPALHGNMFVHRTSIAESALGDFQASQTKDVVTNSNETESLVSQQQQAQGPPVQAPLSDPSYQESHPVQNDVLQPLQETTPEDSSEQLLSVKRTEVDAPKPFPMLPGQVTPLPSQIGSAPVPVPMPLAVSTSSLPQAATSLRNDSSLPNSGQGHIGVQIPQAGGQPAVDPMQRNPQASINAQPMTQPGVQGQMCVAQTGVMSQTHQAAASAPQSNSSITDAGKSMKKWAKKMFSSGSDKATAPVTIATHVSPGAVQPGVLPQNMYRQGPPQQNLQMQGSAQTMSQLQATQMYTLPARPQPPLMAVPENQPLGQGSSQLPSQPVPSQMKQSASTPQIPQVKMQFQASQGHRSNSYNGTQNVQQQPAMQRAPPGPRGQPLAASPGQFQQWTYQQQIGPQTTQRPANGQYAPGVLQPQMQGLGTTLVGQARPHGNAVPANISARRSSGSSIGQPPQRSSNRNSLPPQGLVPQGQMLSQQQRISHEQRMPQRFQQQPQSQVQRPLQPREQQYTQQTQQQVQQPGQQRLIPQTDMTSGGKIPANGGVSATSIQTAAHIPHQQSFQGHYPVPVYPQAQGQYTTQGQAQSFQQTQGSLPVNNITLPKGSQSPHAPVVATTQTPKNNTGNAGTWSNGKTDYSGGEWGDHWYEG